MRPGTLFDRALPKDLLPRYKAAFIEAIRASLSRDRAVMRSGTRQMASFRLDSGLLGAVKEWAKDEGITDTEAINQAFEVLLGRR